jgi:hypothetical protein
MARQARKNPNLVENGESKLYILDTYKTLRNKRYFVKQATNTEIR